MRARRLAFEDTVDGYSKVREQICTSLAALSSQRDGGDGRSGIVFYGAGNVAEIAYVAVQRTDLTLVGVVDDYRRGRFFNLTIAGPDALTPEALDGIPYSRLLVTSIRHSEEIRTRLRERGVRDSRISCL